VGHQFDHHLVHAKIEHLPDTLIEKKLPAPGNSRRGNDCVNDPGAEAGVDGAVGPSRTVAFGVP
jgi:hypothetical protein